MYPSYEDMTVSAAVSYVNIYLVERKFKIIPLLLTVHAFSQNLQGLLLVAGKSRMDWLISSYCTQNQTDEKLSNVLLGSLRSDFARESITLSMESGRRKYRLVII